MSNAFECVMNGRAFAPPAMVCRIGVSSSINPDSLRVCLIEEFTIGRRSAVVCAVLSMKILIYFFFTRASSAIGL